MKKAKRKKKSPPLLYYRTMEQIAAYKRLPLKDRLAFLEAQMEFFYKTMPGKARRIRDAFLSGSIVP